jgi:hypothetical protein
MSMNKKALKSNPALTPKQARRRALVTAATSFGALGAAGLSTEVVAQASNYPTKPIRMFRFHLEAVPMLLPVLWRKY